MREILSLERREGFWLWLLLILLTAVFLRLYQLDIIPPGLTHDEADHGITAVSILHGTRSIYFTVGHGREPLFDYAVAGLMALLGQNGWVLRLTAVLFSLLVIGGMAAWVRLAFNQRVALLTAAGLAVGFWPVMAGRQGLRSITLPALFSLALYLFWRGLKRVESERARLKISHTPSLITDHQLLLTFLFSGLFLGLTFYTYIPARGLWLLFPFLLLFGALANRTWLRQAWPGTLLSLAVAAVIAAPLFIYLQTHPGAEIRIGELSAPLTAALQGDLSLLWANIKAGVAIFTVRGDPTWRYNIPERPLLGPFFGWLFYGGLALACWQIIKRGQRPFVAPLGRLAHMAALIWLLGGLAPVLITGADLSMTQGMGMQPVVYLFPALAIDWVWQMSHGRWQVGMLGVVMLLFGGTAVTTAWDYFIVWANAPEVRVQYEHTMTAALTYVANQPLTDVAISTITPGEFHTPALAAMTLPNQTVQPRWFDGRGSLIVPQADEALLLFSGYAPLPDPLTPYLATAVLQDTLPLRPNDADRPVWIYRVQPDEAVAAWQARLVAQRATFGEAATLLGYELQSVEVARGEVVQIITVWQLHTPPPDLRLFTHLVGQDGVPVAQADRLDAPSGSWLAGDWLVQLHAFMIPEETAVGSYPLTLGLYTCLDAFCEQTERLAVTQNGETIGDNLPLTELTITE